MKVFLCLAPLLFASAQAQLDFSCPDAPGERNTFALTIPNNVSLTIPQGHNVLCTLALETESGAYLPLARSYNGHRWERAGGGFASRLEEEWSCVVDDTVCTLFLPAGSTYVLQRRGRSGSVSNVDRIARFLEAATFGGTRTDLAKWGDQTFAQFIEAQINMKPTLHREFYRQRMNPSWQFHQPEFAARLNPCAPDAVYRRNFLSLKDQGKPILVQTVNGRREVSIDGHVRSMPVNLRAGFFGRRTEELPDGQYTLCGNNEQLQRGLYRFRSQTDPQCRFLNTSDLLVDFPDDYIPAASLSVKIGLLENSSQWQIIANNDLPVYRRVVPINPVGCTSLEETPAQSARLRGESLAPIFAQTQDGQWLLFDPIVRMESNTMESPLLDGGLESLSTNRTLFCSNVARSFLNEGNCVMTDTRACLSGGNANQRAVGGMVCGSPGEVANDPSTGVNWLDISSITNARARVLGVPRDSTPNYQLARQREFVWSEIALTSNDQLRQRMAWALFQIFALPKSSIQAEVSNTEFFIQYYDIFVRNAFSNYGDILREITYNPLMAESLSFRGSRSLGIMFARTQRLVYPDENFARELMQLFTIGLVELNIDGTPVLDDSNKTQLTYSSDDIVNFARAWTGFVNVPKRANVEGANNVNRLDPMRIVPGSRDRFPKTDLAGGYIGDGIPLCSDFPAQTFLKSGAKYRLLGRIPLPELVEDSLEWALQNATKRLVLLPNESGLFEKLCEPSLDKLCSYPSIVVLDTNLSCPADTQSAECNVDELRVVQLGQVFYEYIRPPCTQFPFFENGRKAMGVRRNSVAVCADPRLVTASEACCPRNVAPQFLFAQPNCMFSGERMMLSTAVDRCNSTSKDLCDYRRILPSEECPHVGYHWTDASCNVLVKVNEQGAAAIVHEVANPVVLVRDDSPSYFGVYWENDEYPRVATGCGGGNCKQLNETCICSVTVTERRVFTNPPGRFGVLNRCRVGFPNPTLYFPGEFKAVERGNVRIHSRDGSCCDEDTVFEVVDRSGRTQFLKNVRVTVTTGSEFSFRNPPQFNSLVPTEFSVRDAQYETDAVLESFLYHQNTPPFVAYRIIQRLGLSNPSPRYVARVARAFSRGIFEQSGSSYGTGKYGDLAATVAAALLDREVRTTVLDADPSHGSLREPILKVLSFMRAMEFESSVPLVELDLMERKIGQAPYEQPTVFNFFRPEHAPPGVASTSMLVAPEAEVMSSGRVVGILNGLFSLIENGLTNCDAGFGAFGCFGNRDSPISVGGRISYQPNATSREAVLSNLCTLLTGGRLDEGKRALVLQAVSTVTDGNEALQAALQFIATTPEFHATTTTDAALTTTLDDKPEINEGVKEDGYKAVIHLALRGGCDSFNMLAPDPRCSLYTEYASVRDSIALEESDMLPVASPPGQPCDMFGVHHALPFIRDLYEQEELVFFANMGVLTEPVDRENYRERTETVLFAHNAMQDEIDTLDPFNVAVGTGTLGRMADVLQTRGYKVGRTAVESTPVNLGGEDTSISPVFTIDEDGVSLLDVDLSNPAAREIIDQLNGGLDGNRTGVFGEVWSSILSDSVNQSETLYYVLQTNTETTVNFTETSLGKRVRLIAQLIKSRVERGVERDFFFVTMGGFDSHNEVIETLEGNFIELNEAVDNLVTELKEMGIWDDVVITQTSDFARTLTPNSSGGSDHAWGGNYWLAGGGVNGKRILGQYPTTFAETGPLNVGRGRLIPTTSFDACFNGIGDWMGVETTAEMDIVLPNRNNFDADALFQSEDLFT